MADAPPQAPPLHAYIRLLKEFHTQVPAHVVRERAVSYMGVCEYKQKEGEANLQFNRGEDVTTIMAFTPRAWAATAAIFVSDDGNSRQVQAWYVINVAGQAPSRLENKFWIAELDGLQNAVETGIIDAGRSRSLALLSLANNIICFVVALAIIGAGGALGASWAGAVTTAIERVLWFLLGTGLGIGTAYLVGVSVFGIFVSTPALPYAPERETDTNAKQPL
ncbi:MAG TPA: hypothetical protein VEJ63_05045 [Planctomycetota bacterium]|nr:hypothetical protein [Planctomycetota bacterium]